MVYETKIIRVEDGSENPVGELGGVLESILYIINHLTRPFRNGRRGKEGSIGIIYLSSERQEGIFVLMIRLGILINCLIKIK